MLYIDPDSMVSPSSTVCCRPRPSFFASQSRTFTDFRQRFPDLDASTPSSSSSSNISNPLFEETEKNNDTFTTQRHRLHLSSVDCSSSSSTTTLTRLRLPSSLSSPCIPTCSSSNSECSGPTQILDFLFLGSQEDALDSSVITGLPINKVINISENCPRSDLIPNDENHFLRIPIKDTYDAKLSPFFEKAFEFIEDGRRRKKKILVHCLAGISRSATLAIAYIMRHKKMSAEEAYKFVQSKRSNISPNFNFMGQLTVYESNLRRAHLLGPKPESSTSSNNSLDDDKEELKSFNINGKRTMNKPLDMPQRPRQLLGMPSGSRPTRQPLPTPTLASPSTEFSKLDISLENPLFSIDTPPPREKEDGKSSFYSTQKPIVSQNKPCILAGQRRRRVCAEFRYELRRCKKFVLPCGTTAEPAIATDNGYRKKLKKTSRKRQDKAKMGQSFDVIDEEDSEEGVFVDLGSPTPQLDYLNCSVGSSTNSDIPRTPESGYLDDITASLTSDRRRRSTSDSFPDSADSSFNNSVSSVLEGSLPNVI